MRQLMLSLPSTPRSMALAALATLVALVGGCGGSGAADAPVPRPPDPVQAYREAVGRECLDARLDRELLPNPRGSGARDLAAYLEGNLSVARRSERRLEQIVPPPAVAAQHRRGRRVGRAAIGLVDRAARDARSGKDAEKILRRLEPALNRRIVAGNEIADELRTPQCFQEPLDLGFSR